MAAIIERVLEEGTSLVKKYVLFTAEDVSTGDTITLDSLTAIDAAVLYNRATSAAVTQTDATNIITIGGDYTDVDIIGLAVGS